MTSSDNLKYAGFWSRLGAMLLDLIISAVYFYPVYMVEKHHHLLSLYLLAPNFLFVVFFDVWLVKRFGGTPGKLLMRLRIRKLDGSPVGWREALLRDAPNLVFWLASLLGVFLPQWQMTDAEFHAYHALPPAEYRQRQAEISPVWYQPVGIISGVWFWSEFVVLLTNRKRRALHDFLAGTVVIRLPSKDVPAPRPSEPGTITTTATTETLAS